MTEQHDAHSAATAGATPPHVGRGGAQLLHELLAIAYHVFEEAKQMNLKPPLQPSSRMFSLDAINATGPSSPPRSPGPPDSPSDDNLSASEMNGSFHSTTSHGHHGAAGGMHTPVIPFSPEEIQDSFTRIATLKSQYVKVSTELLEFIKQLEARRQNPELAAKHAADERVWLLVRMSRSSPLRCGLTRCALFNAGDGREAHSAKGSPASGAFCSLAHPGSHTAH
jgi:hypothetical protein